MKKAVVFGAGGFIGGHLARKLKKDGYWVRGVDLKEHEFRNMHDEIDDFVIGDLRDPKVVADAIDEDVDELYQLAADMGGAGFVFTGDNDADIMHNSALINLNTAQESVKKKVKRLFYSSSACIYPEHNQCDPDNPNCVEHSAYPANPDSEYGWEKLFSERMYDSFRRNYDLNVSIARFHNIFGPEGSWMGGREKAPAAMCRKVADCEDGGEIEVWGTGEQTRSFLYIDECLEAIEKFMDNNFAGPVNIGSEEMISINGLVDMVADIAGKKITRKHINGPLGVNGRNSHNELYEEKMGWRVGQPLRAGMEKTYKWIAEQLEEYKKS